MRIKSAIGTIAMVAAVVTAGCGNGGPGTTTPGANGSSSSAQGSESPAPSQAQLTPTSATPSLSPAGRATEDMAMGAVAEFAPTSDSPITSTVTVQEVRVPSTVPNNPDVAPIQLVDADVQVCITGGDATVGTGAWSLVDSGGRTYPASWYSNAGPPPYPPSLDYPVLDGDCVRGWAMFETAVGSQITEIRYRIPDRNASWVVG